MNVIIVVADWKLEEAGSRTFGMCSIDWSPPYDNFSVDVGFDLPVPSNNRVAARAICVAADMVSTARPNLPEDASVVIVTKNKWVYDAIKEQKWDAKGAARVRALLISAYGKLKECGAELLYIERQEDDPSKVDLYENRGDNGFDADEFVKKGGAQEQIEAALNKTRMLGIMEKQLASSGAKCFRSGKKKPKSK